MAGPFAGGHRMTGVSGEGPFFLRVRFETTYPDMHHQLYSGRILIGQTDSVDDRAIMSPYFPSLWPEHLSMLAVDAADRLTDFGALLAPRPYNRVKLQWTTSGWSPSTKFTEITAGTEVGGDVDLENVLANVPFAVDGVQSYITDPLPGSGRWNFEAAGRDQTKPYGNRGTAVEIYADIYAHPPDVQFLSDEYNRFDAAVVGADLVASFTESEL